MEDEGVNDPAPLISNLGFMFDSRRLQECSSRIVICSLKATVEEPEPRYGGYTLGGLPRKCGEASDWRLLLCVLHLLRTAYEISSIL